MRKTPQILGCGRDTWPRTRIIPISREKSEELPAAYARLDFPRPTYRWTALVHAPNDHSAFLWIWTRRWMTCGQSWDREMWTLLFQFVSQLLVSSKPRSFARNRVARQFVHRQNFYLRLWFSEEILSWLRINKALIASISGISDNLLTFMTMR